MPPSMLNAIRTVLAPDGAAVSSTTGRPTAVNVPVPWVTTVGVGVAWAWGWG